VSDQAYFGASSTTLDKPSMLLVTVRRDGPGFIVNDSIGLRYGWAETLREAVAAWAEDVAELIAEPDDKLGEPLLTEVRNYRSALAGVLGEPPA
jgi:hypothetical protein